MFASARIQLTAWYLAIIMLVSILFSLVIYNGVNREFDRFQTRRMERLTERDIDPDMVSSARERFTFTLVLINLGILGVSGLAGYFLAGRTLRPIQKMVEDQNRFIADASHEFRTPLTSLKTSIEVALRGKEKSADVLSLLNSNLDDVNNLQVLSDNLLQLAQYSSSSVNSEFVESSIKPLVVEAIAKVTTLSKDKNIAITLSGNDYQVLINKKSIGEVLVILLDNAIKYSPKDSKIVVSTFLKDEQLGISIKDQGIGIDVADIPHIFNRFYRGEKSRSKQLASGFGLGLSIAKRIIDSHNGDIKVTSKKNNGSEFTILLPVS